MSLSNEAVASAVGLLSVLPFPPADIATAAKAWRMVLTDEGVTDQELQAVCRSGLKKWTRFPAPAEVLAEVFRRRSSRWRRPVYGGEDDEGRVKIVFHDDAGYLDAGRAQSNMPTFTVAEQEAARARFVKAAKSGSVKSLSADLCSESSARARLDKQSAELAGGDN